MNWYKTLKKSTIVLSILYIGILCAQATAPNCECEEVKANVWYKVSTDSATYGEIIRLDMSRGQSFSQDNVIVIVAQDLDTKDIIYIAFPDGGDWKIFSQEDSLYMEMEEDIDDLQKYLDSKESQMIRKKY